MQDGLFTEQDVIAADDKDFPGIFKKICEMATVNAFQFAELGLVSCKYSPENLKSLETAIDVLREEFLDTVFGFKSKVDNKVFVEIVCEKCPYLLYSGALRKKLAEVAKVAEMTEDEDWLTKFKGD